MASDIVRVSPNELSFASAESWKSIYGHPVGGTTTMVKSEFYEMFGSGFDSLCIASERNPHVHSRMRKSLTPAFSTKALVEQESIVQSCIDEFIEKVGERGTREEGLNLSKWFEMLAFDIVGEMAFGETFHCIENGKPHHWSEMVTSHVFIVTLVDNLRRYPLFYYIGVFILPKLTFSVRNRHSQFSRDKVARRLESQSSRKDLLTNLVEKVENGEVGKEEMTAHASTLMSAEFFPLLTYILKNPSVHAELCKEIRACFNNISDINATAAQQLPYLQAVISESLRIYPPASQGFLTEVYTSAWTVTHDPRYFHDPYVFKPSRWLDPANTDLKEASQPFSLGPRGCLGRNFAYVEMCSILAKLFYAFDLELLDSALDWEKESRMHVMWWKPSLPVRFRAREKVPTREM
ncbi:uncharacterized protein N7518_005997 [Penicillium psychrosexuale]|uniref:uncharacterized protein n=1 Tax=Penicillium psychrosexuale TaxID=1002107 RepID=UPI0025455B6A|nr:uncharacterized protein N7518_005997 [Penicillium psychrosexuale]KAJ5788986.1 hypothetical protein N7518_005997 [Penicillium psychrosexuale]